jgi:N-acyl-L-homoserine lactone synthetase
MLRTGKNPSLQALDECISSIDEKEPFLTQNPSKKSRNMRRVTDVLINLSKGESNAFKDYVLHNSRFFSPVVKRERKGFFCCFAWVFSLVEAVVKNRRRKVYTLSDDKAKRIMKKNDMLLQFILETCKPSQKIGSRGL